MALINLRNALMAGKRLPYDAEVEFLESTGTQWIDTGVKIGLDYRVSITFMRTVSGTSQALFGGRKSYSEANGYTIWAQTDRNNMRCDFTASSNPYVTIGSIYDNAEHTIERNGVSIILDGATVGNNGTITSYTPQYNSYLFAVNQAGTASWPGRERVYSCRIWDANGVLVRDFIPVRKGTTGELYDRVSGKFAERHGEFVLGQDVVPVEYLQSTGTQWIDTGIVPTADDSFYCRIQQSSIRDQCLWGLASVAYCFSNCRYAGDAISGTYWGHPAFGTGGVSGVNPLGDTNWHEILCQPSGVLVDGVQINTQVTAPTQSPLNTVALFARSVNSAGGGVAKNGQGRISAFKVEHNGDPLRFFRSIRVGTDATSWEGAMMDVLTRRIYRNAGTGAFTFGNDLKYPIPAE